ncbi:MAG: hypothetical protein ACRCXT_00920 [Paraclostridium sp.]
MFMCDNCGRWLTVSEYLESCPYCNTQNETINIDIVDQDRFKGGK